jgi:hypothetical protein
MTDESLFDLNGYYNSQLDREWFPRGSGGNPTFTHETSIPRGKLMIWVGLLGKTYLKKLNKNILGKDFQILIILYLINTGDGRKLPLKIFRPGQIVNGRLYKEYVTNLK